MEAIPNCSLKIYKSSRKTHTNEYSLKKAVSAQLEYLLKLMLE